MDETVDLYKKALAVYQRDPAPWSILYGVVLLAAIATAGLGAILVPNAIRATREALDEERPPDLQRLFVFGDDLLEDAIAVGGVIVGSMVAGSFLGPLASLVSILLGLAPPAVTEPSVGGLDALQLSVGYVQKEPVAVFVFGILSSLINTPAVCCFFPLFATLPITGIAHTLFYEKHRAAILMLPEPKELE